MTLVRNRGRAAWVDKARCRTDNVEDYFPGRPIDEYPTSCIECPVIEQCLEYALVHERHGFWANTTQEERAEYRKTVEFDLLVLRAKKEGWLEPHNLAPASLLSEVNGLNAAQASPRKETPIPLTGLEFSFPEFEFPSFYFVMP